MKLDGIEGNNLWGFMAALGTLRLLDDDAQSRCANPPRLHFDSGATAEIETDLDRAGVIDALARGLSLRQSFYCGPLAEIACPGDFTEEHYDRLALMVTGWQADVLAGLACGTGRGMSESTLCAANGAGHQNLLQSIRDVLALVNSSFLRDSLFSPWQHSFVVSAETRRKLKLGSRKPTLRLDPGDERLYAMRANDPTSGTAEFRTELGAQALAVPGFEVLPVLPAARPRCVASHPTRQRMRFEWCLWSHAMSLRAVRSLIWSGPSDSASMRMRGATSAFQASRVVGSKGKLSISPTRGLW